jgi:ferrous iron transport protein A
MANTSPSLPHRAHDAGARLSAASPGEQVRILHIAQEAEHAAWLRAVGMHEEAEVTVLRRAPFGGPIHLRSRDGGEFAIHRDLARCIQVALLGDGRESTA